METKEQITKGIGAHGMWKQRLVDAINTGVSEWTPAIVKQDNQCEFGKWLYSCSAAEKQSPHYEKIRELHAQFHKEAAQILDLALTGKKQDAEARIAANSDYRNLSGNLTREMMAWKSEL
jgi:hypothetical protein